MMNMRALAAWTISIAGLALVGCAHSYQDDRPPTDSLAAGNTGIQAKDVLSATDMMGNDLLKLPELNASDKQWAIVISKVQNNTSDQTFTYGVFDQRLRSRLSQLGHGRVALIENKAQYHKMQNEELEQPNPTAGGGPVNLAGVQPDYDLYITIDSLPNRATDFFEITATLTNTHTRVQVWNSPPYEFQSSR